MSVKAQAKTLDQANNKKDDYHNSAGYPGSSETLDLRTGWHLFFNLPNCISLFRLSLLPVIIFFLYGNTLADRIIAFSIMIFAGILDMVDGIIARRMKMVSDYGTALDPIVDKIMVDVIALFLIFERDMPVFYVASLWIRDIVIVLFGVFLYLKTKIVFPSNRLGKYSNAVFIVSIGVFTLNFAHQIKIPLVVLGMVMIILSALGYFIQFIQIYSRFVREKS